MNDLHRRALRAVRSLPHEEWDPEVAAHVTACESCRSTVEALGELRARLQGSQRTRRAPDSLRRSILDSIDSGPSRAQHAPAPRARRNRWWTVAAALIAGLALGLYLGPRLLGPSTVVDGEVRKTVADYLGDVNHDRYLLERTGRPLELVTDEPNAASKWLSEGLGFEVALADVAPEGWDLAGTRVWHTVSRLSALAEYGRGAERIMVFAVPATGLDFGPDGVADSTSIVEATTGPLYLSEGWGCRGAAWKDGPLAWSAVCEASSMSAAQLAAWVDEYRRAQAR